MQSDILAEICARKRAEIDLASESRPLEVVSTQALSAAPARNFASALEAQGISMVAEIKRSSPSRGDIAPGLDPVELAAAYESAGASALSVLTDEVGFSGTLTDLTTARAACGLPVLRKDFVVDRYQIYEARAGDSDAVLLIVAALRAGELAELIELAEELSMAALVEVHDRDELRIALDCGAEIVGVNNRDLRTFEVSLGTCLELSEEIPSWVTAVAESGIASRGDVERIEAAGYDAILVGESLLVSGNVEGQVAELLGR